MSSQRPSWNGRQYPPIDGAPKLVSAKQLTKNKFCMAEADNLLQLISREQLNTNYPLLQVVWNLFFVITFCINNGHY